MATLITCKTCQKQISSTAELCPNCGHPHKKDRDQAKYNREVIMILIVAVLGLILWKTGLLELIIQKVFGDFFPKPPK